MDKALELSSSSIITCSNDFLGRKMVHGENTKCYKRKQEDYKLQAIYSWNKIFNQKNILPLLSILHRFVLKNDHISSLVI